MSEHHQKPLSMVLATVGTPFEAQRIVHLLRDRNLGCLLRDQETIFSVGRLGKKAGILILVSAEDYSQARQLLESSQLPSWAHPPVEA